MAPLKSARVAWSIAVASLALWAMGAPLTWGQVAASAWRLFEQPMDESSSTTWIRTGVDDTTTTTADDAGALNTPCPSLPTVLTEPVMPPSPQEGPAAGAQEGTFHLCGADAQVARSIEQLIAGRGFSATLSAKGDGCADLTIRVNLPVSTGSRASSSLKVSLGSGQSLSIQIVSEDGATRVSVGQDR